MKLLHVCAVCAVLLLLAFPAPAADLANLPVTGITLVDDQGAPWPHSENLMPLAGLKPGDMFTTQAVREGIGLLYLKGMFKDIIVDAFPDSGGVRLVYTLLPVTIVDKVVIRGNHAVSTDAIREVLARTEGREFSTNRLPLFSEKVRDLYAAEGYADATVDFTVEPAEDPHRVVLTAYLVEHEPAIIESITFDGNTVFRGKELLGVMKSKKGKPLQSSVLMDTDLATIVEEYSKAGYPAARPGPVEIRYEGKKAFVRMRGIEGPKVTVRFSGNRVFNDKDLRKELLIWSEHDVSDAIIEGSVEKIKTLYRETGYKGIEVSVTRIEAPGTLDLEFRVSEGRFAGIKTIIIRGNTFLSTEQIRDELNMRESGWFRKQPFRDDLLTSNTEYLKDRYIDAGFLSAVVKSRVEFPDNASDAVITIEIDEGPRTRVRSVTFEGNSALNDNDLRPRLVLKPGEAYSERLLDEDRYRILTAYTTRGFLYARVDVQHVENEHDMDIVYRITEDQPVRIGRIVLRGNERTKDAVILRELVVKPGDPYDYGAVLSSQQRIYRLGFFGFVRFEPLHPGEKEYVRDMLLSVEERPAGAVEVGVGYGNLDRFRGSVEVSYRNLWGQAEFASLRFEGSDIIEQAVFNFREPWFLRQHLEAGVRVAWSDEKRLNPDTRSIYYQTRKTAVATGLSRSYDNGLKLSLIYQLENVGNYNVMPDAILTADDSGRVLVSSITPGLILDKRDDPFNPRSGSLQGIAVKEAMHAIGSQADFMKLTIQSSWFFPITHQSVLALSGRGGMAWPERSTTEIPIHERFYLGGATTLRGYLQDAVGPGTIAADGAVTPTGGASMVVVNAEVRLSQSEGFGFVLFADAGNVWAGQSIVLNDLRASYGAGIRYNTPVGPLRLDYGQKIHRRSGESPGELHFNIGNMF